MKKIFKASIQLIYLSLICMFLNSFCSCTKKSTTCKAQLSIVDSSNKAISGASIHIYTKTTPPAGQTKIEAKQKTGTNGIANFEFALQAIFDVDVTTGTITVSDKLNLQSGETVKKTISIN